ncbi:MAG: SDR family oxidoreductase [Deltaproteobacteria bacterium]|nr:SDR family oxidoreductase [Deltaproteobacteria bacterium]
MNIRPQNVLIVGGSEGIGFSTAEELLKNGVRNIYIASRSMAKLERAAEKLRQQYAANIFFGSFDISNCSAHLSFLDSVKKEMGAIPDGLVISAGVHKDSGHWRGFNMSEADWDLVINTNLKGVFFLIRNYSNWMIRAKARGNICVVSSQAARRDLLGAYQISKNAISGVIHAYGKHLFERGITLNGIEPGLVDTPMMSYFKGFTDGIREGKSFPDNSMHRLIRPEEIAGLICFLMSDASDVLSGTVLLANGGAKSIPR